MEKPKAISNRNVAELRHLLYSGKGTVKSHELKEIARWAIHNELEWRDKEAHVVRGLTQDTKDEIEDLEKEIEGLEEEINGLEKKHEEEMIEFAKEGAEITL